MDKITVAYLDRVAADINLSLRDHDRQVSVQGRNGRTALDLYRRSTGECLDTLLVGTKREVYTYLAGMSKAQSLAV